MKKVVILIVSVSVLSVGGFLLLYSNLDSIIRTAIESYGTKILGVKVAVESVELDAGSGLTAIKGLEVANPEGYEAKHAFVLNQIKVQLNVESLTKPVVRIKEVLIDRPTITYEMGKGGSNLQSIYANVKRYMGDGSGSSGSSERSPGGSDSPEKKLIIDKFSLQAISAAISLPMLGKPMQKTLPDIRLYNLGRNAGGATPKQIAEKIVSVITRKMTQSVQTLGLGSLPTKDLQNKVQKRLKQALGGKKMPKAIQKQLESLGGLNVLGQ